MKKFVGLKLIITIFYNLSDTSDSKDIYIYIYILAVKIFESIKRYCSNKLFSLNNNDELNDTKSINYTNMKIGMHYDSVGYLIGYRIHHGLSFYPNLSPSFF